MTPDQIDFLAWIAGWALTAFFATLIGSVGILLIGFFLMCMVMLVAGN